MQLGPGTSLAHYEIISPLGKGAMGEVYRAKDTKLGREVAIKILPADVASDGSRLDRFRREARALAALDHPNIVTVYSVEETGGIHFLTMGLIKGRSFEDQQREGVMTVPVLIDIALQLTGALAAAHEKGVIHRDLKPANVMLSEEGRVTILDFGLAKLADSESIESEHDGETEFRTNEGIVMGTAPYMSPEQLLAKSLDLRSDIFSLGILLHEMATGRRPFQGDNAAALCSAILRDDPPLITEIDPRLPSELAHLIANCMKKDPADRYQSALEVHGELDRLKSGTLAPESRSNPAREDGPVVRTVVVLPFVNRSPDPDNEYFCDGLTEEVISDLSRISALRVISRNSAMTLKGTTKDTPTIARELGVSHLITGTVRRAGNALRVTAELVDAEIDAPIWSEKYSGSVEDVFGIQEEISRKIVSALEVELTGSEERRVAERPIENTVAYDCYLRARQEAYGWTLDSFQRASRLVDEALAIVGDNPLLLATKGQIHWNAVNSNLAPAKEGLARASEFSSRALALDPDLPLAIYLRGLLAGLRGQPESALPDLYRAHDLSPNDANILVELCRFSNVSGLRNHGALVDRLAQLDPLTAVTPFVVSSYHWVNGHRDQIAPPARRAIELAPSHSMLQVIAGWQVAEAGFHEEASEILRRTGVALAGAGIGSCALFLERALAGDEEGALAHSTPEMEAALRNEFSNVLMAGAYALIGRPNEALDWLGKAIGYGFINHPYLADNNVFLKSLGSEPAYQALMDELEGRWKAIVDWERRAEEIARFK